MSGIESGGKSGTPPIGHGPSAITRTKHPRDEKKDKKNKNHDEQSMGNEGHDEFAVRVDASLFHLKSGDIIEGNVVGRDGEDRLILDSPEGHFHLAGHVNLQPYYYRRCGYCRRWFATFHAHSCCHHPYGHSWW